jgi:hypothetical protein
MAASATHDSLSYEQREIIVFADRERRASTRPSWSHLAKSAFPEVYREAQRLLQEQYRREAITEQRTTTSEKWAVIEAQIRETMAEGMEALDALEEHVKFWTVCEPVAIARILGEATTEQERLDVVLGSHMQVLLKEAQGKVATIKHIFFPDNSTYR